MDIDKKLDQIMNVLNAQSIDIAIIKEHIKEIERHEKLHDEHRKKIEDLEKNQFRAIGALGVIGVFFTFLGNWVARKF